MSLAKENLIFYFRGRNGFFPFLPAPQEWPTSPTAAPSAAKKCADVITPFTVLEDNKAAIAWSSNNLLSQKMRHVERNLLYVRKEVLKKTFQLKGLIPAHTQKRSVILARGTSTSRGIWGRTSLGWCTVSMK